MKNIFCILGFSSSGKDSITNRVSKELNIPILRSHTTRPIRVNESEDAYYFVDDKFFIENKDKFIEKREYKVADGSIWKYGLHEDELIGKENSLFIVDKQGYNSLVSRYGDKVISIFIEVSEDELDRRNSLRGDDKAEFKRRIQSDKEQFKGFISDYVVYNNNLDDAICKIKQIIELEMEI